jgi:hypothetical protein
MILKWDIDKFTHESQHNPMETICYVSVKILRIVNHGFRWMFSELAGPVIFDAIPAHRRLNLFRALQVSIARRRPRSFSGNE